MIFLICLHQMLQERVSHLWQTPTRAYLPVLFCWYQVQYVTVLVIRLSLQLAMSEYFSFFEKNNTFPFALSQMVYLAYLTNCTLVRSIFNNNG